MDLIYTNEKKEDIGVLSGFDLDLAYGKDENDFECKLNLNDHCCESGYLLYIDGTEYGGVIDSIGADTANQIVTYSGRTWQGILEGKAIEPDSGHDYLEVAGDANGILRELLTRINAGPIFSVKAEMSGVDVSLYRFRYDAAYSGICKMLAEFDAKLCAEYKNGTVELWAALLIDYSQNEEFDTSQVNFLATKNYRPINHVICLGTGELKDRYIIHLFADEWGGIQPYSKTILPLSDADYITDKSGQKLFGIDEVCEIHDNPNAQETENFVPLPSEPSNWKENYTEYYTEEMDEEGELSYTEIPLEEEEIYLLLEGKPADWETEYEKYYEESDGSYSKVSAANKKEYLLQSTMPLDWQKNYGEYYQKIGTEYQKVKAATNKEYIPLIKKPNNWSKKYGNYFTIFSDGTKYEYVSVSGISKERYQVQTIQPSNWRKNFGSYYKRKNKGSGYEKVEGTGKDKKSPPAWEPKKYYTKYSYSVAPAWEPEIYLKKKETDIAPVWEAGKFYTEKTEKIPPTWKAETFYRMIVEKAVPRWKEGIYFKRILDHYADLVEGGLEILKEALECDDLEIDLDPEIKYDIGDIVGAFEPVTGIRVAQPITKKIVTIDENGENIEYEVGW